MKLSGVFLCIGLGLMAGTQAETKDLGPIQQIEFESRFGHNHTVFEINPISKNGTMNYSGPRIGSGSKEITSKNTHFLIERALTIARKDSNEKRYCLRDHFKMTIHYKNGTLEKIGCMKSKTAVAVELKSYSSLLALLL